MRGRPVVAAGVSALALAAVAALFGGTAAVPGTPVAAPAPPVSAAGAAGAALPAAAPAAAPTTTTAPAAPKPSSPPKAAAPERPAAPKSQAAGTVRLRGGGEARLVRTELGPDATLPVPESLREATWWGADLAADEGATVLAGHVNWRGRTGPFAELWDARVGDHVSVVDPAGKNWSYQVSEVVTLGKDELPARAEALFGQSGEHRLVLVTCGGRWVGGSDGYESNRIVVAVPA
ncbi:class F sortase [Actinokineospora guangxiensis]|uniref:Class F sortase n=1 Tax=Actinokineospora guangxiensis TaxID=1490288 RepID=A0ABW0EMK1_9PSEU